MTHGYARAVAATVLLFAIWTAATWVLEGRTAVLQRPAAGMERWLYTIVANVVIGVAGSMWLLHKLVYSRVITINQAGFREGAGTLVSMAAAVVLGGGFYIMTPAAPKEPLVVANVFAQVFATSMAEVLVCWALVGGVVRRALSNRGAAVSAGAATIVASVLFGIYHFAHSAPFNTWGMVGLLTVVGFATSAFFFASRNVYAAILFHNFLAVVGVGQALAAANVLAPYRQLNWGYVIQAMIAAAALLTLRYVQHHTSSRSGWIAAPE